MPATLKPVSDVALVYTEPAGVLLANAFHPLEPSGEYCHWNVRPGVPPAEAMPMLAVVPPTHISAGEVGCVVTDGSATTFTTALPDTAVPQPLPDALTKQR